MTITELANQLGEAIAASEEIKAQDEAKNAFENDSAVQNLIFEYNAQNAALSEEFKKEERDQEIIDVINRRIAELYNNIAASETYLKYIAAQKKVNALMNTVNNQINKAVYGESDSENCTHDCSSCHGCH